MPKFFNYVFLISKKINYFAHTFSKIRKKLFEKLLKQDVVFK